MKAVINNTRKRKVGRKARRLAQSVDSLDGRTPPTAKASRLRFPSSQQPASTRLQAASVLFEKARTIKAMLMIGIARRTYKNSPPS
jgi:hypothetical protein